LSPKNAGVAYELTNSELRLSGDNPKEEVKVTRAPGDDLERITYFNEQLFGDPTSSLRIDGERARRGLETDPALTVEEWELIEQHENRLTQAAIAAGVLARKAVLDLHALGFLADGQIVERIYDVLGASKTRRNPMCGRNL
jgi:hypothetical protein